MPKPTRTKLQADADRIALKMLRELGLISKKVDIRKFPSRAQRANLQKFADVVEKRAVVVTPADAKSFKGLYPVHGKKVIIPRRKGEIISVEKKTGRVVTKRRVGNRIVSSEYIRTEPDEITKNLKPQKQYAIPFNFSSGVQWKRFPTMALLKNFMMEYTKRGQYQQWRKYVVEETVSEPLTTSQLNRVLEGRGYEVISTAERIRKQQKANKRAKRKAQRYGNKFI